MSEMQLFVQMAQQHSQEREHRKFVERAETEGWDWRTTLTEAAKRGITDNKHVVSYLDQKRSLEEMQKAEKEQRKQAEALTGKVGSANIGSSSSGGSGIYSEDPVVQGANSLANQKQQAAAGGISLIDNDPNRRTGFQPGVKYDTLRTQVGEGSAMDSIATESRGPGIFDEPGKGATLHPAYQESNPLKRLREIPSLETSIVQHPDIGGLYQLRESARVEAEELQRAVDMKIYTPKEAWEKAVKLRKEYEEKAFEAVRNAEVFGDKQKGKLDLEKEKSGSRVELEKLRAKNRIDTENIRARTRSAQTAAQKASEARALLKDALQYEQEINDIRYNPRSQTAIRIAAQGMDPEKRIAELQELARESRQAAYYLVPSLQQSRSNRGGTSGGSGSGAGSAGAGAGSSRGGGF